jgi:hypothetical protein
MFGSFGVLSSDVLAMVLPVAERLSGARPSPVGWSPRGTRDVTPLGLYLRRAGAGASRGPPGRITQPPAAPPDRAAPGSAAGSIR